MQTNDPDWSYAKHIEHESLLSKIKKIPSCYTDPDSIDAWRHKRMYETLLPLIESYPHAKWITVGDGKYGSDAYFLETMGRDVLATSLTDENLLFAKKNGYIRKIEAQNAENISADDNSFDFVFCKESYHHFPRPPVAFYEMLRISKLGVVLIEPLDSTEKPLGWFKVLLKKLLRRDRELHFESTGNYIFKLNIKEISKMSTALNYENIAFKKLNDFYYPKFSFYEFQPYTMPTVITGFGICFQDLLCALRLLNHGLVTLIAFKKKPSDIVVDRLKKKGFSFVNLPKNPYL